MARKKKYVPKDFETDGSSSDTSANIYHSMIQSEAFRKLTKNQRLLYLYMKSQYYGVAKHKHPSEKQDMFYFNKHLWCEVYGLYTNAKSFEKDRDALIEKGFIKVKDCGYNTKTKAVYQFSLQWRLYGTSAFCVSASDMSLSMLRKQRNETNKKN